MARLDVIFASRYLQAHEAWRSGQPLTDSWKIAFEATKTSSLLILQQLLLGINAHINLDLGAVETMKQQVLEDIHTDFDTINTIIGSLTYQVLQEIDRMSPLLSLMGCKATTPILFSFSSASAMPRDGRLVFRRRPQQANG